MRRLGVVMVCFTVVLAACGHRDRDANTGETRSEREQRAAEKKRAKQEAREREREEKRHAAAERAAAAPPPSPSPAPLGGSGTCETSCQHYLRCKNLAGNFDTQQKCVGMCNKMNLTQQQLAGYEKTDCVSAIAIVEGQGSSGGAAAKSTSSQCTGCVWDGSSCIWLSQSNWGAGPYSGAYSTCDAACCRR